MITRVSYNVALKFTISFFVLVLTVYCILIGIAYYMEKRDSKTIINR